MLSISATGAAGGVPDVASYAAAFAAWLDANADVTAEVGRPVHPYAERVTATSRLMARLYDEGWSRYGWPEAVGGLGGSILHRAAMWDALARQGVLGMAVFEHLEVLAPTLVAMGPQPFVAQVFPEFLRGRELWCQGFSEPAAGSDLASLRTRAQSAGDGYVITGRKIWTSWARYATWCLVLARTGTPESRHRGLTAFVVDLRSPGVQVSAIEQANGTDELAEVAFDEVYVPADRVVGEVGGGWPVAMHILSHERGTFAWFRHCFLYRHVANVVRGEAAADGAGDRALGDAVLDAAADGAGDRALGDAVLDLAAVSATSVAGLRAHAEDSPLGPRAAFTKLLLCAAEQSVNDWALAAAPDIAIGVQDGQTAWMREEYLFSRIVTVYGGSQQMQLETIAKQILRLP
jgi:alkylation response protein AidB-like acyl-CoA dehydrogenase